MGIPSNKETTASADDREPRVKPARRGFVEVLLGGGLAASIISFVYPVQRYLVPPAVANLGGDEIIACKVGDLKPNSSKIFRFGNRPGLLLLTNTGHCPQCARTWAAPCNIRTTRTKSGAPATTGCTASAGEIFRARHRALWRVLRCTSEARK
jgi:hypothetical protein